MTTCRTPASAARRKYSSKYLVRAPWKLTKCSPKSAVLGGWSRTLPSRTSADGPPTARQNNSAYGSTASWSGFCASNARAVATNNAVEPTLVVMSQVSPSLRTQRTLLRGAAACFPVGRNGNGRQRRSWGAYKADHAAQLVPVSVAMGPGPRIPTWKLPWLNAPASKVPELERPLLSLPESPMPEFNEPVFETPTLSKSRLRKPVLEPPVLNTPVWLSPVLKTPALCEPSFTKPEEESPELKKPEDPVPELP